MKKWLIRWLVKWFVVKLNLYLLWSRFHQKLFQRKRVAVPTKHIQKIEDLEDILGHSTWRADKWWMLWDVISHPEHAYREYIDTGSLGDCDDFANFSAYCIEHMEEKLINTRMLCVAWLRDGKFLAHCVCMFMELGIPGWFYIGNYYNGLAMGMFATEEDVARHIVGDGEMLSWFTFGPDLKKVIDYKIY